MPDPIETFIDRLHRNASDHPSRALFNFTNDGDVDELSLSYGDVDRRARALGALLQDQHRAGERALLLYPPGPELASALFGCLYAGVIAVPAYPPHPARLDRELPRLKALAQDAGPTLALTTSSLLPLIEAASAQTLDPRATRWLATDTVELDLADHWKRPDASGDTVAVLQYTSGSTGSPRGVMLTHGNLMRNLEAMHVLYETTPETRLVAWVPLYHDMGLIGGLLGTSYIGATGTFMSPLSFLERPSRWLRAISRVRATHSAAPDFAYALCVRKISPEERSGLDLRSWSFTLNGAEPVRASTIDAFVAAFQECGFRREAFYPAYGLAECTVLASGGTRSAPPVLRAFEGEALARRRAEPAPAGRADARVLVGCGRPPEGHRIAIVDPETSTRCREGEIGEIWIAGPSVAAGYWGRPEETRRTFQARIAGTGEGPFLRTGDLGFIHDGELFIAGREKDLIVLRGLNHYPQDIEATVVECHRRIRPGCVAAFSVDEGGEERLVIVAEIDARGTPAQGRAREEALDEIAEATRAAVRARHAVDAHAVALIEAGRIPKTSSGKIQRHAARLQYLAGGAALGALWLSTLPPAPEEAPPDRGEDQAGAAPGRAPGAQVREVLRRAPQGDRARVLGGYLAEQIARLTRRPLAPTGACMAALAEVRLDSLAALDLLRSIEADLGVRVPAAEVVGGSMREVLDFLLKNVPAEETEGEARVPAAARGRSRLLEMSPSGSQRPFFCAGGAVGTVLYLAPLARAVGSEQPFCGFGYPGLDGEEPPLRRVEDLAALYVEEMREVQPQGPYVVGGHSFGGLVAYEIAQQLRDQGQSVERVVLMDTMVPRAAAPASEETDESRQLFELAESFRLGAGGPATVSCDDFSRWSRASQLDHLRACMERLDVAPPQGTLENLFRVYRANVEAMARYRPRASDVPVTLLKATGEFPAVLPSSSLVDHDSPTLGWERLCAGELEIREVPGDHFTMVRAPHVDRLAEALRSVLGGGGRPEGALDQLCPAAPSRGRSHVAALSSTFAEDLWNPQRPEFLEDPHPFYARLRAEDPVHWSAASGVWVLTRYQDVVQGIQDDRLSNDSRNTNVARRELPEDDSGVSPSALCGWIRRQESPISTLMNNAMLLLDPPRHTRLRALMGRWFTPATVEAMRHQVQHQVQASLGELQRRGGGDLIRDVAMPLPTYMMSQILGLPREDVPDMARWSTAIFRSFDPIITREILDRANHAVASFVEYIRGQIERRKRAPGAGLLDRMIAAEVDGDRLTPDELVASCVMLLAASADSSIGIIGSGFLALHRNPEQLRLLREDPRLIDNAVEELLRYDASITVLARVALEDIEIRGKTIRRGDSLLLSTTAANRDPERFDEPDRLDLRRRDVAHIATFGRGRHYCLGASLARMELKEAILALVQATPALRVIEEGLVWRKTFVIRAPDALPVTFGA
ncbi:cytochrome P450 [Sorangium sp. So ce269]